MSPSILKKSSVQKQEDTTSQPKQSNSEVIDWSSYETDLAKFKNDEMKDLMFFPKDNVKIRSGSVDNNSSAVLSDQQKTPTWIQDIFDTFNRPPVVVKQKYKGYKKTKLDDSEYKHETFEIDAKHDEDDSSSSSSTQESQVKIDKKGLKASDKEKVEQKSKPDNRPIFKMFDMCTVSAEYDWAGGAEKQICHRDPEQKKAYKLSVQDPVLIDIKSLKTELNEKFSEIEPLFCSICLFDLDAGQRISEYFHFDITPDSLRSLFPQMKDSHESRRIKKALFHVSNRNEHIYMFIKINRVMHSEDDGDTYVRPDKARSSDIDKIKKHVKESAKNYPRHHQPLAWTAAQLFDSSEELNLSEETTLNEFYRTKVNNSDETTVEMLQSMFISESIRKPKTQVPATCVLSVQNIYDFKPEYKFPDVCVFENDDEEKIEAFEVREFPVVEQLMVLDRYVNCLYARLEHYHLSSRTLGTFTGTSKCIGIQVEMKEMDQVDSKALKAIYGKSSEAVLHNRGFSSVSPKNKHPEFNDEFKIDLPVVLTDKHHLIFHIYNLGGRSRSSSPSLMGIAVLPIFSDGRVLSGTHEMQVYSELPDKQNYLSKLDEGKFIEGGRKVFKVTLDLVSSVYPTTPAVSKFFTTYPFFVTKNGSEPSAEAGDRDNAEKYVAQQVKKLGKEVSAETAVQFMPAMFGHLYRIICGGYPDAKREAFHALLNIVSRINDASDESTQRNSILTKYVHKIFRNIDDAEHPVFEELTEQWLMASRDAIMKKTDTSKENLTTPSSGSRSRRRTKESGPDYRLPLMFSYFLFDTIYKSMVLWNCHHAKNKLPGRVFSEAFQNTLSELIQSLSQEVIIRSGSGLNIAKLLNSYLALFLSDILNVMDRGFVLRLIQQYLGNIMADNKNAEVLQELKITFLKIVADFEHYVPMSLPIPYPPSQSLSNSVREDQYQVSFDIRDMLQQHYLCGILLSSCMPDFKHSERTIRNRALGLIREMLTKHDYDSRYQDRASRERIACMYFPLALKIMEITNEYEELVNSRRKKLNNMYEETKKEVAKLNNQVDSATVDEDSGETPRERRMNDDDLKELQDRLSSSKKRLQGLEQQVTEEKKRSEDEMRELLVCFMYVVKNMSHQMIRDWWLRETPSRVTAFLHTLHKALEYFQYPGREKIRSKVMIGSDTSTATLSEAKATLESMYTSLGSRRNSGTGSMRRRKKSTLQRNQRMRRSLKRNRSMGPSSDPFGATGESEEMVKTMILWEGNLSSEISLIAINIVLQFFNDKRDELVSMSTDLTDAAFRLMELLLTSNQSTRVLDTVFPLSRYFVKEFRTVIFNTFKKYSEVLCRESLRHAPFLEHSVRSNAALLLYSMLKHNFLEMNNFSRVKIQSTVALSRLVSDIKKTREEECLRNTFEALAECAKFDNVKYSEEEAQGRSLLNLESEGEVFRLLSRRSKISVSSEGEPDSPSPSTQTSSSSSSSTPDKNYTDYGSESSNNKGSFADQVSSLSQRLGRMLEDDLKIRELQKTKADTESIMDVYYRIAAAYKHAPELSVTWFSNLADRHAEREQWVEAAQCIVYTIAVVAQYFKLKKNPIVKGLDFDILHSIAPYLKHEKFTELRDVFRENKNPIFESSNFHEDGFLQLIDKAIEYFERAEHYEFGIELYKFVLPIHESDRNYERMQTIHSNISSFFGATVKANQTGSRLFGSYFRVGFFGAAFDEDIRNKEFIYKMPKITRLAHIKDYIERNVPHAEGTEIAMINSSGAVDPSSLKSSKAYVQITSVAPYFTAEEVPDRVTYFERHTRIDKFIFETPFTKSGKSQGSLDQQYKKKTILTTEYPFPCLKTRNLVVAKEEQELTPIENAIEIIESSNIRLRKEIMNNPPDANNLQLALSGCVIPKVHEGIPGVVHTFLDRKDVDTAFSKEHIHRLKEELRDFLLLCEKGLQLNKNIMDSSQAAFAEQMEIGFAEIKENLSQYLEDHSAVQKKGVRFAV